MMRIWVLLVLLPSLGFASSEALLNGKGSELNFSKELDSRPNITLDDPFLIQLYAEWKSNTSNLSNEIISLIFNKNYNKALKTLKKNKPSNKISKATELYLLYKLELNQSFLSQWINYAGDLRESQLAIGIDQTVNKDLSQIFNLQGFALTESDVEKLEAVENLSLNTNYFLQGLRANKKDLNLLKWIGKLPVDDKVRLNLAYRSVYNYAQSGKLGASGKIVKRVIEPWIEKSEDTEEISIYYLTLARLLYQVGALEQSEHFYSLIPQQSKYFLQARTEVLWIHLRSRNFSKAKGELATLELGLFDDRFYPEVYLVSAMANVILCQFSDAKHSIDRYINVNKEWSKLIDKNLKSENPEIVRMSFNVKNYKKSLKTINSEIALLSNMGLMSSVNALKERSKFIQFQMRQEALLQWKNRKKILENSLYRMKFVRVELLSKMRLLAEGMHKELNNGNSHVYASNKFTKQQLQFPNDGVLWSDELFNMNAHVRNLCLEESK